MRIAALALVVVLLAFAPGRLLAQVSEGWTVTAFDAIYAINPDGTVTASEDIRVDFGTLERHGIIRSIPVEYEYDSDNNRLINLTGIRVDDGQDPQQIEVTEVGSNVEIRIGDPNQLVTGEQRYRITYTINRGLNPFDDHDEFYWNVTGNDWVVPIERSSARVTVPTPGIRDVACYQGVTGSVLACQGLVFDTASARADNGPLGVGGGLTIVVGLDKGLVTVDPPDLVDSNVTPQEEVADSLGLHAWSIAASFLLGLVALFVVLRQWWIAGRDRWYGDMSHVDAGPRSRRRPLFAHETIVTEFTPPQVGIRDSSRPLRPAEIGLLVDERADTLDVTATIVDLAVRSHLVISEIESGGVFGLFKSTDYELERSGDPGAEGLPYEQKLLNSLFETGSPVKLSDLKDKFHDDLAEVKTQLGNDVTSTLKLFPRDPEKTRTVYRVAGGVVGAAGAGLMFLLGMAGLAIFSIPLLLAGVLLLVLAPAMPRRTAEGRAVYRRSLGFRRYIETAETERQAFAERANLFEEYLPYAIVFECVDKWAKAFEGLGAETTQSGWYRGRSPFVAAAFASTINDFSGSISSVMASTPGGKGSSGFGGGGFSGGGGGGGGGRSW